jgi:hypothetical protein
MLTRRITAVLAASALVTGAGAAIAVAADAPPTGTTPPACSTTPGSSGSQDQQHSLGEQQNGQQGVDEQGTANDVSDAADAVQQEADNQSADDVAGDQQGPNDHSEEPGDTCQVDG